MKVAVSLFIFFLCFYSQASSSESGKIVLGQSAAFSGTSQALGIELWRGAQAYFQKINEGGGVNGQQIEVVTMDDKYNGDLTLSNTGKLVDDKKVFALFGYVGTPTIVKALPLIKTYQEKDLFLFSNFTGAQPQREAPYQEIVYNIRASYRDETEAIVDQLSKIGIKKFGLFIQDDAYGRSGSDGTQRALKKRNLEKAQEALYHRGASFAETMQSQYKVLAKANVEAIICIASYEASAAFIRDARDSGFKGPIANVSFVGSSKLLEFLKNEETKSNKKYTDKLLNTQVVPVFNDTEIPIVKEYRQAMDSIKINLPEAADASNYSPAKYSFGSLEGYLNAKVFVEVIKRIKGPITRKSFKDAAHKLKFFDAGLGRGNEITFENNQALHKVFMTTIENGNYVNVKKWEVFK